MEEEAGEPDEETGGQEEEAGSSGQASGVDLTAYTRGAWKGSDVNQAEIDWLYRSRRIPEEVFCRIPGKELEPTPEPGEIVVFAAHFERGFGLRASDFFRRFLDFYELQPHHLPANAIFYLSSYVSFMEGFVGLSATVETFARFYNLRVNSIQDKKLPKPKPVVQCGACILTPRQGSPFYKFSGLESCRAWQQTFFYVRNSGSSDFINLPAYVPGEPSRANWRFNPKEGHVETNRIVRYMKELNDTTDICSDDIMRVFVSHRVLPLQRHAHKISQMSGRKDPTRITTFGLRRSDVVLKAKQICRTEMPADWKWGLQPLSRRHPPTSQVQQNFPRILAEEPESFTPKRLYLDDEDPDPFVPGNKYKMGPTHSRRPGNIPAQNPANASDSDYDVVVLEACSRINQERVRNEAEGPQGHQRSPASSSTKPGTLWCQQSSLPSGRYNKFGERGPQTKASPRRGGFLFPSRDRRYRRRQHGRRFRTKRAVGTSGSARPRENQTNSNCFSQQDFLYLSQTSFAGRGRSCATAGICRQSSQKGTEVTAEQSTAAVTATAGPATSSQAQALVLHAGRAAVAAGEKVPAQLGRIVELNRGNANLSGLQRYVDKWNVADLTDATLGVGKDKKLVIDSRGPRSTVQHLGRLKHSVKEFDNAWHDANNNVLGVLDSQKRLFEDLLWEHRDLTEAHSALQLTHSQCRAALPESSQLDELISRVAALQAEKEKLALQHQNELQAQKNETANLKEELIQAGLRHAGALKEAIAAGEAKVEEAKKKLADAEEQLRRELEEEKKLRQLEQERNDALLAVQVSLDEMIKDVDDKALRFFPDSQVQAAATVAKARADDSVDANAPWTSRDRLAALYSRISHMRIIDRHLAHLPDAATKALKCLGLGRLFQRMSAPSLTGFWKPASG
ncbi:hypothetical protein ACQ4PT_028309 [Festuca glaucescens]